MSEYWDLHCETCDLDLHANAKSGDRDLRALWDNRSALVAIHKNSCMVNIIVDGNWISMEWFEAHGDHDVRVMSEYGYCDSDCGEHAKCSCGSYGWCRLKPKHDGPHGCAHLALGTGPHAAVTLTTLPPSR